jgi:hypothetical protein
VRRFNKPVGEHLRAGLTQSQHNGWIPAIAFACAASDARRIGGSTGTSREVIT